MGQKSEFSSGVGARFARLGQLCPYSCTLMMVQRACPTWSLQGTGLLNDDERYMLRGALTWVGLGLMSLGSAILTPWGVLVALVVLCVPMLLVSAVVMAWHVLCALPLGVWLCLACGMLAALVRHQEKSDEKSESSGEWEEVVREVRTKTQTEEGDDVVSLERVKFRRPRSGGMSGDYPHGEKESTSKT